MGNLLTAQANLDYGFVHVVSTTCGIFLQSRQRKMTTLQSVFGVGIELVNFREGSMYAMVVDGDIRKGKKNEQ